MPSQREGVPLLANASLNFGSAGGDFYRRSGLSAAHVERRGKGGVLQSARRRRLNVRTYERIERDRQTDRAAPLC